MSSAISVRRSLTRITGRRPARSATATRKIAARWKWRKRLDLVLRIVVLQVLEPRGELPRKLRAPGHLGPQSRIDQLIEQQRIGGNLLRQKVAVLAQLDQPGAGGGILLQQGEIGGALADRLDDPQDPAHHRQRAVAAGANSGQQQWQQRLQPPATDLIEARAPARTIAAPAAVAQPPRLGESRRPTASRRAPPSRPANPRIGPGPP